MSWEVLSLFGIGFLLGLRHAFDPDHVVAVSTIASRTGNLWKAATTGAYWGVGHTLTLLLIGLTLFVFKVTIPDALALSMEMAVGVMLVILGFITLGSFGRKRVHVHTHRHDEDVHVHFHSHSGTTEHDHVHTTGPERKSFWVGVVHGVAGSGPLVLLTMASIDTVAQAVLYMLLFGSGTIFGMFIVAMLLGLPFILTAKYSEGINRTLGLAAGLLSIGYGLFFISQIAAALTA